MNLDKFTTKSQEALMQAQTIAQQKHHQYVDAVHLALGLLETDFVQDLLKQMQATHADIKNRLTEILDGIPSVSGSSGQMYMSSTLNTILLHSEQEAKNLGDEFISVEHLLLALCEIDSPVKTIFKNAGISKKGC